MGMMGASSCLRVEDIGVGSGSQTPALGDHATRKPQGRNSVLAPIRETPEPSPELQGFGCGGKPQLS